MRARCQPRYTIMFLCYFLLVSAKGMWVMVGAACVACLTADRLCCLPVDTKGGLLLEVQGDRWGELEVYDVLCLRSFEKCPSQGISDSKHVSMSKPSNLQLLNCSCLFKSKWFLIVPSAYHAFLVNQLPFPRE